MKRKIVIFTAAVAALLLGATTALSAMPDRIRTARDNFLHDGYIVALGSSNVQNLAAARAIAEGIAMGGISTSLESIVNLNQSIVMDTLGVNDYSITRLVHRQVITTVSGSTIQGVRVVEEVSDASGHWIVMVLSRDNATAELNSAVAVAAGELTNTAEPAVQQTPHFSAAMDALRRMDEAFYSYFQRYRTGRF